jgi:hypothetical protein
MEEQKQKTGFQPGNQWWAKRATHGRKAIFQTPEKMMESAIEYFKITDERKWKRQDFRGKDAKKVEIETDTPYTMAGLCIFLGVNTHYFNDFETNLNLKTKKGRDFSDVIRTIKDIMFSQKFEGAAVGAFQQNIIARDLGLANRNEITHVVEQPLFGDDDDE